MAFRAAQNVANQYYLEENNQMNAVLMLKLFVESYLWCITFFYKKKKKKKKKKINMYAFGDEHQVAQYYHEYVKENLLHVIFCMDVTP